MSGNMTELLAVLQTVQAEQEALTVRDDQLQASLDEAFVIISAISILNLQTGFMLLETGVARAKNTKAILMKNVIDLVVGISAWFLVGFGLYSGDGKVIAGEPYTAFLLQDDADYAGFVQSFGFAITGTTIMSGAVLSRMNFGWYVCISIIFVAFVYPVSAHWAWADNGFLGADVGFKDFAGSGVVHMVGGIYGAVGAWVCGPRAGRFVQQGFDSKPVPRPLPGHSSTLQILGVMMLTISWLFFNAGSTLSTDEFGIRQASRALANSILALSTSSALTVTLLYLKDRTHHLTEAGNAILAGLVAITGPCGYVDPWAAMLIGLCASVVYLAVSHLMLHRLHIDDPVDAFAVHGACGALGVLAIGIFDIDDGLFYGGGLSLMLAQLIGLGVLVAWALLTAVLLFVGLNKIFGIALDEDDQLLGLDIKYHEGYAYPEFSAQDVAEYNRTRDAAARKMGGRRAGGSESWAAGSEGSTHSVNNDLSFRSNGSESSTRGKSASFRMSWRGARQKSGSEDDSEKEESPRDSGQGYV